MERIRASNPNTAPTSSDVTGKRTWVCQLLTDRRLEER
jgi:hypothetical protein